MQLIYGGILFPDGFDVTLKKPLEQRNPDYPAP